MTTLIGRRAEQRILLAGLRAGRDLLLEGPAGTGKSLLVRALAIAVRRQVVTVEGSSAITTSTLVGQHEPAQVLRGGFDSASFVDGPLLRAMRSGHLLHIEEANRLPSDTLDLFLEPLGERRIAVPRVGTVHAAPGFCLVATVNDTDPSGTRPLSRALGERLVRLGVGYQSAAEEQAITRQHAPHVSAWVVRTAVAIGRATREHPDLVRGASVRGSIDLVLVAGSLATLEDVDLRDRGRPAFALVLRAALVAMSGRITVRDSCGRSAEDVIREVWQDEVVLRIAVPTGPTSVHALDSPLVRSARVPARTPGASATAVVPLPPDPTQPAGEPGTAPASGGSGRVRPVSGPDGAGSMARQPPPTATALTDQELDDLAAIATASPRRTARRRHRRRLTLADPQLVHRLAVQIIVRRARHVTRGRRGTGPQRAARYRFQSDDLDLDRSLEEIAANPVPTHENFWVQERSAGRRAIVLMVDVSGSMRGAPLVRAALAAATASVAAALDDLATILFWSQALVVTSVENPRPLVRVVEEVLAVRSEGLTDISQGLSVGLRQLERSRARDRLGILVTDGVSNHGGDPARTARLFPRLHVLSTATTPRRLEACHRLAAAGGGECHPVPEIADIPSALTRCLDSPTR